MNLATRPRPTLVERLLPWTAALLLVGVMTGAAPCLYWHGQSPIRPRDFTIGLVVVNLGLALLCRPGLRYALLPLLILPTLRMVDAIVLKRFIILRDDGADAMLLVSQWLVVVTMCALLSLEQWRSIVLRTAIAAICANSASVLAEQLGWVSYSSIAGRPSGFMMQPNDAGILLGLCLPVVLTLNKNFWGNVLMIGIGLVGLGLTLSRSGMVTGEVTLWVLMQLRRHPGKVVVLALVAVQLAGVGVAVLTEIASSRNFGTDVNAKNRIEGLFGGDTSKMGSDERLRDLKAGWEAVQQNPLWGYGTGSASSRWEPHNLWVATWLELGLIGPLMLILTLGSLSMLVLMHRGEGLLALVPLWGFTVFSQNLLDMTCYWFAAASIVTHLLPQRVRFSLGVPR
jgi:hypothetical protein